MDSQEKDILSSYRQLKKSIDNFRGADSYVLDVITKVSAYKQKIKVLKIEKLSDVVNLLTDLRENRL